MQKMTPPARRKPAETKVTHNAPPGWYLLLAGRSEARYAPTTSLANQEAGAKHSRPAKTKQAPAATAVWPLARLPPPQRVHLRPRDARQRPSAATRQDSTMAARVACRCGGSDSVEVLAAQLKTPELNHTQSSHRPCICCTGDIEPDQDSALTAQLGSSVATVPPSAPSRARAKARTCRAVESIPGKTPTDVSWFLTLGDAALMMTAAAAALFSFSKPPLLRGSLQPEAGSAAVGTLTGLLVQR